MPILFRARRFSFAESLMKLPGELKSVKPTVFLAPPRRVWERMYSSIRAEVQKKPRLAQKVFHASIRVGVVTRPVEQACGQTGCAACSGYYSGFADRLIFRSDPANAFRRAFGDSDFGRCAPVRRSGGVLRSDWHAPLIEGYGLTEGGVAAFKPTLEGSPSGKHRESCYARR